MSVVGTNLRSAIAMVALTAGVLTAVPGTTAQAAAQAANTFTVTTTADDPDANPGDGRCATAAGQCSLRAAIQQANASAGPNSIRFAIPGGGAHRISPATELPAINDQSGPTTIDGYTQPGASANTAATGSNARIMVELVGSGQPHGLRIGSAGNTIRGLSITGFNSNVYLVGEGADGNRIVGNFVGPRADGSFHAFTPTSRYTFGVHLALGPDQNMIGAPTLADRNVISGNGTWGVSINHGETSQNFVQNNVIGLTPDLSDNLPQNIGVDVQWWTWGNLIGGDRPLERNLISGNQKTTSNGFHGGVDLSHDALHNQVIGNYIGTLGDGNSVAPHTSNTQGFLIKDNANDNYIAGNVIANSLFTGIRHRHNYSSGNVFVANRIGVGAAGGRAGNGAYGVFVNGHDHLMVDNLIAYNRSVGVVVVDQSLPISSTTRYQPEKTLGNAFRQNTFHSNGNPDQPGSITQVDAGTYDDAAAVDSSDRIYRFVNGGWQAIGGRLKHVSVGTDGSLWGVNSANNVYRQPAGAASWQHIADNLTLVQVDAGTYDDAAAVDSSDRIYRFVNGGWQEVGGRLKHVSVGTDGSLWGVNSANNVYRRAAGASGWQQVPDTLTLVQVDAHTYDQAVAIDSSDRIYRFVNGVWQEVGGRLMHVSVGTDGSFWGVNSANNMYRRGAAETGWRQIVSSFAEVHIDLDPIGANANDPGDADDGPHLLLNTPEFTGMGWINGQGEVYGTACAGCTVEISVSGAIAGNGTLDPTGSSAGIGATWVGTVTARSNGTFSLADQRLRVGKSVSAIAIDQAGNTSEMMSRTMPGQPSGILGNPMTSQARFPRPAAPDRPEPWASPSFACSHSGTTLTWDNAGAPEYYVFQVSGGSETYLGGHRTTSLSVPRADSYRVTHWGAGFATTARCDGPGAPGPFACSVAGGVLQWSDTGARAYYVFAITNGTDRYLGGHSTTSLRVPSADSYRVVYWAGPVSHIARC